MELLSLQELEPPMGDTAGRRPLSFTRALWAAPLEGENGAPASRIIHARVLQLHNPAALLRLGVGSARGYHKCGSVMENDWVTDFRVLVPAGEGWRIVRHETGLTRPAGDEVQWFDLEGIESATLMIEVRRCGIDGWWPGWNLASGAFLVEGECARPHEARRETLLEVEYGPLSSLPGGLYGEYREGEVRYKSAYLDVGLGLGRAGLTHLGMDGRGGYDTSLNLLRQAPGIVWQGPLLHPVGGAPVVAPVLRNRVHGTTAVSGNRVRYDLTLGKTGVRYVLEWEVFADRLVLHAERRSERPVRAWQSAAWHIGFNPTATPPHLLGRVERTGETGVTSTPAWLHLPNRGSFLIEAEGPVRLRSDANRPIDLTTLEVKLGETSLPAGDYLLPEGRHTATITFRLDRPEFPLHDEAPEQVRRAVEHCGLTAITYRPDTATLSNNGASMHCPICMDMWSAVAVRLGSLLPDLEAADLLRDSLERWLDGGPGYASGPLFTAHGLHMAEDEYLMTGAAGLLGLADFLEHRGSGEWLERFAGSIRKRLDEMRARDLDGDGLIESPYRTGVSGADQWSTCWFDVISFGWKDAFSNAILYTALRKLAKDLSRLERPDLGEGLAEWADRLYDVYAATFFNPDTGWLAGWRCREGRLHDHAFLFVNGAAVAAGLIEPGRARNIMERLLEETERIGLPDPYLGLPGNLHHIPDEDLADIMQGYPLGYYQNGGRSHAQTRHFLNGLYRVGLTEAADALLSRLCEGLADGAVFGGCRSGKDWRFWDGRPCGYEGLLTDQFGVLATALERYRP